MTARPVTLNPEEATEEMPLCACMATEENVTALGFPVELRVHCVGAWMVVRPGMSLLRAAEAARVARVLGLVCVEHRDPNRGNFQPAPLPQFCHEAAQELFELGALNEEQAVALGVG